MTIDGEPIDLGIIQFSNGVAEGGGNVQEGKYTAKVPTGELTVRIRAYRYTGPMPKIVEPKPGDLPPMPPQRPRKECSDRPLWENPTMKVTVEKKGVYDLSFENPVE